MAPGTHKHSFDQLVQFESTLDNFVLFSMHSPKPRLNAIHTGIPATTLKLYRGLFDCRIIALQTVDFFAWRCLHNACGVALFQPGSLQIQQVEAPTCTVKEADAVLKAFRYKCKLPACVWKNIKPEFKAA